MKDLDNSEIVRYKGQVFRLIETGTFERWVESVRDRRAMTKIIDRLKRAANGNFGDVESVGGGVSELRIHYGPGYRLYFFRRGQEVIILLCGGDKSSQRTDIECAKQLKAQIEQTDGDASL